MQSLKTKVSRYFHSLDYILLLIALLCSAFGLVLIFSATYNMDGGSARYILIQGVAIVLGLIGFFIITCIDLEKISWLWPIAFIVNILFQLSLILFGYEDGGNKSWLRFGGIGIQPAEVGKLLFIFTFAKHITILRYRLNRTRSLLVLGLHLLIVMAAIILPSKDVGMSLPYVFIAVIMLFAAGLSLKWFAGGIILVCAAVPILWQILSGVQKNRILVLFDPSIAPDTFWQQQQSRIAIGAGKLFGAGYLQGNQTQNNMIPEKQTDFIFGVAGEEWGMLGCMVILALLIALIIRIFYVAYLANGQMSSLICVGVGSMILFQTFENIFMCLGIGPVMGLTLPFFSYGGSSIATMYLALGMVVSVYRQQKLRKQEGLPVGQIRSDEAELAYAGVQSSVSEWFRKTADKLVAVCLSGKGRKKKSQWVTRSGEGKHAAKKKPKEKDSTKK